MGNDCQICGKEKCGESIIVNDTEYVPKCDVSESRYPGGIRIVSEAMRMLKENGEVAKDIGSIESPRPDYGNNDSIYGYNWRNPYI